MWNTEPSRCEEDEGCGEASWRENLSSPCSGGRPPLLLAGYRRASLPRQPPDLVWDRNSLLGAATLGRAKHATVCRRGYYSGVRVPDLSPDGGMDHGGKLTCHQLNSLGGPPHDVMAQTNISVMASPDFHPAEYRSNGGLHYEMKLRRHSCCALLCDKTGVERVIVLLLLGALLIIFSTVVLSLIYLKSLGGGQGFSVVFPDENGGSSLGQRLLNRNYDQRASDSYACTSTQCLQLSERIERMSSKTGDPCSSFYEAACGGWVTSRNITRPLDSISYLNDLQLEMDRKIKDLVESIPTTEPQMNKVYDLYQSCLDTDQLKNLGNQPFLKFLHDNFNSTLDPAAADHEDLTQVLSDLLQFGGSALFDITVEIHPHNNSRYVFIISLPAKTGHPALFPSRAHTERSDYPSRAHKERSDHGDSRNINQREGRDSLKMNEKETISINYKDQFNLTKTVIRKSRGLHTNEEENSDQLFMDLQRRGEAASIGTLFSSIEEFGLLSQYSQPFKQATADEIVGFIAAVLKALPRREEELNAFRDNAVYNIYNLVELQALFKYVNWQKLLQNLVGGHLEVGGGLLEAEPLIVVHFPTHLRKLERVVSLFGVRVARLGLLTLFGRDFHSNYMMNQSNRERWRYCVHRLLTLVPNHVSYLYINTIQPSLRSTMYKQVEELSEKVRREVIKLIEKTSWLSNRSIRRMVRKVEQTRIQIRVPENILNKDFLQSQLKHVNISPKNYLENVVALDQRRRKWMYSLINGGVSWDEYCWQLVSNPLRINAFHIHQLNSVVLPFGLLYRSTGNFGSMPPVLAKAPLAFVIAHEILHGIDVTGLHWDEEGKLSDILDSTSFSRLSRRLDCLDNSNSKLLASSKQAYITYDNKKIRLSTKPKQTVAESFSDVEALKVVAQMFGYKQALAGTDKSTKQLLFYNIAQTYCGVLGSLSEVLHLNLSPYPSFSQRIDGMVMYSSEFAEAFKCPLGSRLNPIASCSILGK